MSVSFTRKSFWPPDGCQKNCIIAKRNARVRSTIPIRENLVWRDRTPNDRPFTPQENQCLILHFLVSLGAQEQPDIALIFHINVEINWQLSKQGIRWPVSPDRIAGSGVDPSRSSIFWSYPLTIYSFSNDRRLTFTFVLNSYQICCVYVSIAPHYYDFDFKLTSDAKIQPVFLKYRRARPFLTMVTCWSCSTSNFYALIG